MLFYLINSSRNQAHSASSISALLPKRLYLPRVCCSLRVERGRVGKAGVFETVELDSDLLCRGKSCRASLVTESNSH